MGAVPSSASCGRRKSCCPGVPAGSLEVLRSPLQQGQEIDELGAWVSGELEPPRPQTNGSSSSRGVTSKSSVGGSRNSLSEAHRELLQALEQCPDTLSRTVEPSEILTAILAIERVCRGNVASLLRSTHVDGEAKLEVMIDEKDARYCICHDPTTPLATGFFWTELADVTVEQAVRALAEKKERRQWDENAEFDILRGKKDGDPSLSEITFHLLRAPWPFWDREVLQRRSRLELSLGESRNGNGVAFVAQSVEDSSILGRGEERIRATVHMAGHLLRPLAREKSKNGKAGIEVTVCNKLDIGGVAPAWAQSLIARFAAKQSQKWAERLRQHCLSMRSARNGHAMALDSPSGMPVIDRELSERELMGW